MFFVRDTGEKRVEWSERIYRIARQNRHEPIAGACHLSEVVQGGPLHQAVLAQVLGVVPPIVELVNEGILIFAELRHGDQPVQYAVGQSRVRVLAARSGGLQRRMCHESTCLTTWLGVLKEREVKHVRVFPSEKTNQQAYTKLMNTKECASPLRLADVHGRALAHGEMGIRSGV